jgi:hypothetical protein
MASSDTVAANTSSRTATDRGWTDRDRYSGCRTGLHLRRLAHYCESDCHGGEQRVCHDDERLHVDGDPALPGSRSIPAQAAQVTAR